MAKFEGQSQRLRERKSLTFPVRVRGRESTASEWMEITRVQDVTALGARFTLMRPTEPGRVLHLTLPMPRQLRSYDWMEDQYQVWALVRRVHLVTPTPTTPTRPTPITAPRFEVGVAFIGARPPGQYERDPSRRFQVGTLADSGMWMVRESAPPPNPKVPRTDDTRLMLLTDIVIELFDEHGQIVASENTVSENISRRGAAVYTQMRVEQGRFVRLISARDQVSLFAAVRACRPGPDGVYRMHLEFLDGTWPLDGIA